jgi:hypothetical protein
LEDVTVRANEGVASGDLRVVDQQVGREVSADHELTIDINRMTAQRARRNDDLQRDSSPVGGA